jgi:hypothetical protein
MILSGLTHASNIFTKKLSSCCFHGNDTIGYWDSGAFPDYCMIIIILQVANLLFVLEVLASF